MNCSVNEENYWEDIGYRAMGLAITRTIAEENEM